MYVAIRRYDGIEPSAVAEVVRRVTAEASASALAAEQELERWADEGGFIPQLTETAGFQAYYLADAGNGVVISHKPFWRSCRGRGIDALGGGVGQPEPH